MYAFVTKVLANATYLNFTNNTFSIWCCYKGGHSVRESEDPSLGKKGKKIYWLIY